MPDEFKEIPFISRIRYALILRPSGSTLWKERYKSQKATDLDFIPLPMTF